MKYNCSICNKELQTDTAAVLTIGGYGTPRYLCSECEGEFDVATSGTDPEKIGEAMQKIGDKMANNELVGKLVFDTVSEIFATAKDRAEKIKNGTYDFSLDDAQIEDDSEDIPEELLESEEDKALDEKEEKRNKKIDKILNWVIGAVFTATLAFIIYRVIERLL